MSIRAYFLRKIFWLKDFFSGGKLWSALKEIKFVNNNFVEGEEIRKQHLNKLLRFAKEYTTFYSTVSGESLKDFPVINKQTILKNREAFLVSPEKIPGQVGKLHIQSTSGSSGIPFSLPQDTNCRIRRLAMIKYGNDLIGFNSFTRLMHLRSFKHYWGDTKTDFNFDKKLNILYVDNANLTDQKIYDICYAINNYKIRFVRGYMTTLDTITLYAVQHNIFFPLKPTFISVGELLSESLRLRVKQKLKCKIVSQYACEESGVLGQSEFNDVGSNIRLNLANHYVEVLKFDVDEPVSPDELGRVVVTDLTNYAMPIIRYDIGDIASIGEVKDGILLSIKNLCGRRTDMITRTDGSLVDFYNSIPVEIHNNENVRQFQFIQKGPKEYLLRLNLFDKRIQVQEDIYKELIKAIVGNDACVNIEFVNEIAVLNSGKRKIIVNEWHNE